MRERRGTKQKVSIHRPRKRPRLRQGIKAVHNGWQKLKSQKAEKLRMSVQMKIDLKMIAEVNRKAIRMRMV